MQENNSLNISRNRFHLLRKERNGCENEMNGPLKTSNYTRYSRKGKACPALLHNLHKIVSIYFLTPQSKLDYLYVDLTIGTFDKM